MRVFLLAIAALGLALVVGCGTGCPTPADCADITCGCLPRLATRPDPTAAALARELPLEEGMCLEEQRW